MAEGGTLPWKIQKLNLAPSLSYDSIHKPLRAPKGKRWNFDPLHKEWSLVAAEKKSSSAAIFVDAVVITEDETRNKKDEAAAATAKKINSDPLSPFVEHHISSSDTFQGICLRYKITPLKLRRANGGFTGDNLGLVPNPLKIPRTDAMTTVAIAEEVKDGHCSLTQSQVVGVLLKECRGMSRSEARAYLMLNDWDLAEALENAHQDGF